MHITFEPKPATHNISATCSRHVRPTLLPCSRNNFRLSRDRFELTRLHRVSVGPIVLGDLKEGSARELSRREVEALYKRCLPLDPLCPTVHQVRLIFRRCVLRALRRMISGCVATAQDVSNASVIETAAQTESDPGKPRLTLQAGMSTGSAGGVDGGARLGRIVRNILEFSQRNFHETLEGPDQDCDLPDFCAGEGESLKHARAVPPNEAHMSCGYKSSQIERA